MFRHTTIHHELTRDRRGGAVIIVVLALLSLMIFLGVFFFEYVQEEQLAAQNYAVTNQFLDPEPYFEEAEKQLIIGPDAMRSMSPLSAGIPGEDDFTTTPPVGMFSSGNYGMPGTPHSLVAHVIGRMRRDYTGLSPTDVIPHNGRGITVTYEDNDADGLYGPGDYARFDMDGDGNIDAALDPTDAASLGVPEFALNFSRPAQINPNFDAFSQAAANALRPFQPDVDYTYPDINNPFLAYDRIDPITGRRILVPSFHRPDLFLSKRSSGFADLYTDASTKRLVMRPHREHRYPDNTRRFLVDPTQAQSGDLTRLIDPFPGLNTLIPPLNPVNSDGDGVYNEMGIYSSATTDVGYDLDVDLTGDGKPDGIWIDSGYDLFDLPDGRQYVPMFSYYVIDADGLMNLNSSGNLQGLLVNDVKFDSGLPCSVSNTGASASEINPLRALTGNPDAYPFTTSAQQNARRNVLAEHIYRYTLDNTRFLNPLDPTQSIAPLTIANIELEAMLSGRSQSRSGSRLTGRYGEQDLVSSGSPPGPGITGLDDDFDNAPADVRYQGGAQRSLTLHDPRGGGTDVTILTPHSSHPNALKGIGSNAYSATGRNMKAWASGSPVVWPLYDQQWEVPVAPQASTSGSVLPVESPFPYAGYLNEDTNGNGTLDIGEDLNGNGILDKVFLDEDTDSDGILDSGEDVNNNGVLDNYTAGMIDEDDETRLRNPDRVYDDIFRPEENLALQASDADRQRLGGTSRIEMLAPFNMKTARNAADIRKQFTTDSWDLSELTYVPGRYSSGFTETSEWLAGSGRMFFPPVFPTAVPLTPPAFLDGTDPFRPEVRALLATEDTSSTNALGSSRRESYDFDTAYGGTPPGLQDDTPLWRQRLNLNKLLVGFDADGYPIFRDLMPHPDMVALEYEQPGTGANLMPAITIPAMIHDHDAAIPASAALSNILSAPSTEAERAQTATAQEWWARYDRQRMARDIYTLLYLVGAPNTEDPVTTNNYATNPERVREIAQFAVNYVDALDRDDVITKFEYDDNLSNGWDSATKHVYGIERASLSFSEVQFLQTKPRSNLATTLHDDDDANVHQYLHMELRNNSPFQVDLAEGWRISRVNCDPSGKGTGTRDKSVEFKTNGFGTGSAITKSVPAGGNFLIGTHDGNVVNGSGTSICSDLYADVENGAQLELILPSSTTAAINTITDDTQDPNPLTDLDLGVDATHPHYQYFTHVAGEATSEYEDPSLVMPPLVPAQTPPTHLVRQIEGTVTTPATPEVNLIFDLVLERRQNLNGVVAGSDESSVGEWIEVDRFKVRSEDMSTTTPDDDAILEIANPGAQAEVLAGLTNLHSVERRQSFDPIQVEHASGSARNHTMEVTTGPTTLHGPNSSGTTPFTLWQPHFDRDFTSAYELMSVPLYGNWPLTELSESSKTNDGSSTDEFLKETHGGTQFNLAPGSKISGDFSAGIRFNFPNGKPGKPYQGWNQYNYQNAWYRLFDFVTVPRRADQQSEEIVTGVPGSTKPVFRVPGKINLNTLRDETVLAAALDDETHLAYGNATSIANPRDYALGTYDNLTRTMSNDPYRNWFNELIRSRDGVDFFADSAGFSHLAIPNSISSKPFRNFSSPDPNAYIDPTVSSDMGVENGLLRTTGLRHDDFGTDPNLTFERPLGVGDAYSSPTLAAPTNFTSTGLWTGTPPYDTSAIDWQGLLDAGDLANEDIDHHTRNRILAKIANNSTTKSHVFFVWAAVGYFEAHQINVAGVNRVQIGARLTDIPIHRRFSVVDMSKIDEAYNTSNNTFEASKFIIFQKRLR